MYPCGDRGRTRDIEAGSGRPAHELVADVVAAQRRLETAWASLSREVWAVGLGQRSSGPSTVADLAFQRWREVEVHLTDLGLAQGPDPWDLLPPAYLDQEWRERTSGRAARVPSGVLRGQVGGGRASRG